MEDANHLAHSGGRTQHQGCPILLRRHVESGMRCATPRQRVRAPEFAPPFVMTKRARCACARHHGFVLEGEDPCSPRSRMRSMDGTARHDHRTPLTNAPSPPQLAASSNSGSSSHAHKHELVTHLNQTILSQRDIIGQATGSLPDRATCSAASMCRIPSWCPVCCSRWRNCGLPLPAAAMSPQHPLPLALHPPQFPPAPGSLPLHPSTVRRHRARRAFLRAPVRPGQRHHFGGVKMGRATLCR
jgi:hypothetical protein